MSMEVKKKNAWSNVKHLIALRWRNGNFVRELIVFLGVALALDLFILISTWLFSKGNASDWNCVVKYGTIENCFLVIYTVRRLFRVSSVLSEDGVSMYPGTVKTRNISRILSDWLLLAAFVAADTVLNLLVTGGYRLLAEVTGDYAKVLVIDSYGWVVVFTFVGILTIYSVLLLLQTLYERVGALAFWSGAFLIMAYIFVELRTPLCVFGAGIGLAQHFVCGGNIPARLLLLLLIIFAVCMFLSFLAVRGIRSWKREKAYGGVALCFIVFTTLFFFVFIGVVDLNTEGRSDFGENTLEQKVEAGEYLVEDSKQKLVIDHAMTKKLERSMDNMPSDYNIQWISLEDAKKAKIVDENVSLQPNEICIRTVVKNSEVQGTSLTKGFLNAKLTVEDGAYRIKEPLRVVLHNNYLSVLQYIFLSEKERQNLEDVQGYEVSRYLGYFILYNKEDVAEKDVPMSLSAGSALDEFMWEIDE